MSMDETRARLQQLHAAAGFDREQPASKDQDAAVAFRRLLRMTAGSERPVLAEDTEGERKYAELERLRREVEGIGVHNPAYWRAATAAWEQLKAQIAQDLAPLGFALDERIKGGSVGRDGYCTVILRRGPARLEFTIDFGGPQTGADPVSLQPTDRGVPVEVEWEEENPEQPGRDFVVLRQTFRGLLAAVQAVLDQAKVPRRAGEDPRQGELPFGESVSIPSGSVNVGFLVNANLLYRARFEDGTQVEVRSVAGPGPEGRTSYRVRAARADGKTWEQELFSEEGVENWLRAFRSAQGAGNLTVDIDRFRFGANESAPDRFRSLCSPVTEGASRLSDDMTRPGRWAEQVLEGNPEAKAALLKYASENGRGWKRKLVDVWAYGSGNEEENWSHLRWIRNAIGPSGIYKLRLGEQAVNEKVTDATTAGEVAAATRAGWRKYTADVIGRSDAAALRREIVQARERLRSVDAMARADQATQLSLDCHREHLAALENALARLHASAPAGHQQESVSGNTEEFVALVPFDARCLRQLSSGDYYVFEGKEYLFDGPERVNADQAAGMYVDLIRWTENDGYYAYLRAADDKYVQDTLQGRGVVSAAELKAAGARSRPRRTNEAAAAMDPPDASSDNRADYPPAAADREPDSETDVIISDIGRGKSVYVAAYAGKPIGQWDDWDEAVKAIKAWMNKEQFWPDAAFINERGNVSWVNLQTGGYYESRMVRSGKKQLTEMVSDEEAAAWFMQGAVESELGNLSPEVRAKQNVNLLLDVKPTAALLQVWREFKAAVRIALEEWVHDHPLQAGASVADLMYADAPVDVLLTLNGEGAGIWDGRWDRYFDGEAELTAVEKHLKQELRSWAEETGTGKLNQAVEDAAREYLRGMNVPLQETTYAARTTRRLLWLQEAAAQPGTLEQPQPGYGCPVKEGTPWQHWQTLIPQVKEILDAAQLRVVNVSAEKELYYSTVHRNAVPGPMLDHLTVNIRVAPPAAGSRQETLELLRRVEQQLTGLMGRTGKGGTRLAFVRGWPRGGTQDRPGGEFKLFLRTFGEAQNETLSDGGRGTPLYSAEPRPRELRSPTTGQPPRFRVGDRVVGPRAEAQAGTRPWQVVGVDWNPRWGMFGYRLTRLGEQPTKLGETDLQPAPQPRESVDESRAAQAVADLLTEYRTTVGHQMIIDFLVENGLLVEEDEDLLSLFGEKIRATRRDPDRVGYHAREWSADVQPVTRPEPQLPRLVREACNRYLDGGREVYEWLEGVGLLAGGARVTETVESNPRGRNGHRWEVTETVTKSAAAGGERDAFRRLVGQVGGEAPRPSGMNETGDPAAARIRSLLEVTQGQHRMAEIDRYFQDTSDEEAGDAAEAVLKAELEPFGFSFTTENNISAGEDFYPPDFDSGAHFLFERVLESRVDAIVFSRSEEFVGVHWQPQATAQGDPMFTVHLTVVEADEDGMPKGRDSTVGGRFQPEYLVNVKQDFTSALSALTWLEEQIRQLDQKHPAGAPRGRSGRPGEDPRQHELPFKVREGLQEAMRKISRATVKKFLAGKLPLTSDPVQFMRAVLEPLVVFTSPKRSLYIHTDDFNKKVAAAQQDAAARGEKVKSASEDQLRAWVQEYANTGTVVDLAGAQDTKSRAWAEILSRAKAAGPGVGAMMQEVEDARKADLAVKMSEAPGAFTDSRLLWHPTSALEAMRQMVLFSPETWVPWKLWPEEANPQIFMLLRAGLENVWIWSAGGISGADWSYEVEHYPSIAVEREGGYQVPHALPGTFAGRRSAVQRSAGYPVIRSFELGDCTGNRVMFSALSLSYILKQGAPTGLAVAPSVSNDAYIRLTSPRGDWIGYSNEYHAEGTPASAAGPRTEARIFNPYSGQHEIRVSYGRTAAAAQARLLAECRCPGLNVQVDLVEMVPEGSQVAKFWAKVKPAVLQVLDQHGMRLRSEDFTLSLMQGENRRIDLSVDFKQPGTRTDGLLDAEQMRLISILRTDLRGILIGKSVADGAVRYASVLVYPNPGFTRHPAWVVVSIGVQERVTEDVLAEAIAELGAYGILPGPALAYLTEQRGPAEQQAFRVRFRYIDGGSYSSVKAEAEAHGGKVGDAADPDRWEYIFLFPTRAQADAFFDTVHMRIRPDKYKGMEADYAGVAEGRKDDHFPGRKGTGERFAACVTRFVQDPDFKPKQAGQSKQEAAEALCAYIGRQAGKIR